MSVINVRNPRTGQYDYSFEATTIDEVRQSCKSLKQSQQDWSEAGVDYRLDVLMRWRDEVLKRKDIFVDKLVQDTGRKMMALEEVDVVSTIIEGHSLKSRKVFEKPTGKSSFFSHIEYENQYVPYPIVAVISPWNVPLIMCVLDAIPALIAGCSVIMKPSEVTPRFIEPLQDSIDAVPELAAVLKVVKGAGDVGEAMINNADLVVFTGSVATGSKVAQAAAKNFIPAYLELGGKDPVIVTEGADIERAATASLRGGVSNAGQLCYSIERIYVDEKIHDEFVESILDKAEGLEINYPDINKGQVGPLIFAKQAEIIDEQIDDAIAKGANILCGGKSENHDGGTWVKPTVIINADHDMKIMKEETFGPVVAIMKFKTIDEAIKLANDTEFGLSGAVFAKTLEEGTEIAKHVNTGGVSVNDCELTRTVMFEGEKMSFNKSGMGGSRYGIAGLTRYCRKKVIIRNPDDIAPLSNLNEGEINKTQTLN